jgi:mono/diheme cytochrome c family protein
MRRSNVALAAVLVPSLVAALLPVASARVVRPPPPPRFDPRVHEAVVTRSAGPPPIRGGTLLALRDGHRVVVSDPDRRRIVVVDLDRPADRAIVGQLAGLPHGAEPGRSVEDAAGRVHTVVLGVGAVVDFDPADAARASRRAVCPAPRGIAYDASADALHVACADGELVTLPASGGAPTRRVMLDRDLRDVVIAGGRLYVTRFRAAEVLALSASGAVEARIPLPSLRESDTAHGARVAWRAQALPDGRLAVLHQRATEAEVHPAPGGYGGFPGGCSGIVKSAISLVRGIEAELGPQLADAPLPVDLALERGPTGVARLAVVAAGNQAGHRAVVVEDGARLARSECLSGQRSFERTSLPNAIAATFASEQRLVVQLREPSRLVVLGSDGEQRTEVSLGGVSTFDTGHAIFHAATARGIACASCHPEGGDDGHVWNIASFGRRRTPALHSLEGTAPFHWSGDMPDMRTLMREVFERRMGGQGVDGSRADAVQAWLERLRPPPGRTVDPEAVARGRALFEGSAQCANCHSGERLTSGRNEDVGTGGAFQVPSLIGVASRLPVMHDGCATTLLARFDPACGGDRHGRIPRDPGQQSDLIAYLESL